MSQPHRTAKHTSPDRAMNQPSLRIRVPIRAGSLALEHSQTALRHQARGPLPHDQHDPCSTGGGRPRR